MRAPPRARMTLEECAAAGMTAEEVARQRGVTPQAVHNAGRRRGLTFDTQKARRHRAYLALSAEGLTQEQAAVRLGVSGQAVSEYVRKHGIPFRTEKDDREAALRAAQAEGLSAVEAAGRAGCTPKTAKKWAKAQGLTFRGHRAGARKRRKPQAAVAAADAETAAALEEVVAVAPTPRPSPADQFDAAFRRVGLDAMVRRYGAGAIEALMAGRPHGLRGPLVRQRPAHAAMQAAALQRAQAEETRAARGARIRELVDAGVTAPAEIAADLGCCLNVVQSDLRALGLSGRPPRTPPPRVAGAAGRCGMTTPPDPFIGASEAAGGQIARVVVNRFGDGGMTLTVDGEAIRAVSPDAARALARCIDRVLQEKDGAVCPECEEFAIPGQPGPCGLFGGCP